MDELTRFQKKAQSYRQALEQEPCARLLELFPIIWYLEKYRKSLGKTRKAVKIVDLMAGSGFLSENLYKIGYTNIHSIEFCVEMCQDAKAFTKARLHNITSFDFLEGVLEEIKPDVIISLASFHHLLVYYKNGQIDKSRSINLQADIVDMCMRSLPEQGILLIADLIDEGVTETSLEPFKGSMSPVADSLKKLGAHPSIIETLARTESLHGASSNLHRYLLGLSGSGRSLRWFRDIVDTKTEIGHKDIAISQEFLVKVANYRPVVTKYVCPWIFDSRSRLVEFVYKKFGFGIQSKALTAVPKDEVENLAFTELGIKDINGISVLGWSLGIVLLGKHEPFSHDRKLTATITYLSIVVCVLVVACASRLLTGTYFNLDAEDLFLFLLTLPLGAIFGDWFASLKDK